VAKIGDLVRISRVINRESHDWLEDNWPDMLAAVQASITEQATPEEIYRHVRREVGENRQALALRVRQAAEHLQTSGEE